MSRNGVYSKFSATFPRSSPVRDLVQYLPILQVSLFGVDFAKPFLFSISVNYDLQFSLVSKGSFVFNTVHRDMAFEV